MSDFIRHRSRKQRPVGRRRLVASLLTLGAAAGCLVPATGCRSGRSPMNLFGLGRQPSAETLAGSGPSATFPVPPSVNATPEAIASAAGGTMESVADSSAQPTPNSYPPAGPYQSANPYLASNPTTGQQLASSGVDANGAKTPVTPPTYALPGQKPSTQLASSSTTTAQPTSPVSPKPSGPASMPSYAAAAANGYAMAGPSASRPAVDQLNTPSTATAGPTGMSIDTAPGQPTSPAIDRLTASGDSPTAPTTSFAPPPSPPSSKPSVGQSNASLASNPSGGGYSFPGLAAAPSSVETANDDGISPATTPTAATESAPTGNQFAMPGPEPPAARQASSAPTKLPSTSNSIPDSSGSVAPAGYRPGSTATSSGYPTSQFR